jgi:sulfoxide reductase catalytic subunit YedY
VPLQLTYPEVLEMTSIEREVLLICPGIFVNHGRWKGLSMNELLKKAGMEEGVTHVSFSGAARRFEKTERFPIADVLSEKVFLAYGVNGEILPEQHGFPLRLVAEDYYGTIWVKYVHSVKLERIK